MSKDKNTNKNSKESEAKISSIRLTFGETKENITLNTNTFSKPSKEQLINHAFNLHSQGKIPEALKYYQNFINQGYKDYRVFCNYGAIMKNHEKFEEAELLTRKAIELRPDFAIAHYNLGTILKEMGKLKLAEVAIRRAIELKPDFAKAHSNLGIILKEMGKLKEAEISQLEAIKYQPKFAIAYLNLGNILKDLKRLNEAEVSILKAIKLKPNFGLAYYSLSILYSQQKDYIKAYKQILNAIEIEPKNHIFKGELTRLKFIQGKYDEKISSNNKLWDDRDDYFFEDNNSDILVISFGSMGRDRNLIASFNFYNLLEDNKLIDKIFFRDFKSNYYLTGLKNSTNDLQGTIDLIKRLSSKKKYRKIISIGSSAGGFAAILFGHLLKFSKVIVFNPQTVLSKEKEIELNDNFYTVDICKQLRGLNPSNCLFQNSLNLKNLIPFQTKVDLHYSNHSEIDTNHAKFIEHKNCHLIKHNSYSHLLALELRDSKNLKGIIEKSLDI